MVYNTVTFLALAIGFCCGGRGLCDSTKSDVLPPIYDYLPRDHDSLVREFKDPPRAAGPWIYWFWFDNIVSKDEIERELTEIARAGFAGVELRSIGSEGCDPASHVPKEDSKIKALAQKHVQYLSDEFIEDLEFACSVAERLGLRFSINMGMGWPPGGTWITEEYRSKLLSWTTQELADSEILQETNLPDDSFVLAWKTIGRQTVDVNSFQDLSPGIQWKDGRGKLSWSPGAGRWIVATFKIRGGGICDKGQGYEADPGSAKAVEFHLKHLFGRLDSRLHRFYGKTLTDIASDSWEYERGQGKNWRYWSPTIPAAFKQYTSTELRPRLYALLGLGPDGSDVTNALTRVEQKLVRDNFFDTAARLLHERGLRHRPQVYGRGLHRDYFEVYGAADIPETEQWVFLPEAPWTARTLGLPIISAEAFTFLSEFAEPVHAPHGPFESNPAHLRLHANNWLRLGVNRLQFHSFGYSPPNVPLPGWRIYAETHFNRNSPWWPYLFPMTRWLQREQLFLQSGDPVADVLVYPVASNPLEGPYNAATNQPESAANAVDAANEHTIDRIRERFLRGDYRVRNVLLLREPRAGFESQAVADFTRHSVPVIRASQASNWSQALADLRSVRWPAYANLAFQHRQLGDADLYFIVNCGAPFSGEVSFPHVGGKIELWDADSGTTRLAPCYRDEESRTFVPLVLGHFESALLSFSPGKAPVHVTQADAGDFTIADGGQLLAHFGVPGEAKVETSTGKTNTFQIKLPSAVPLNGKWTLLVVPAEAITPDPHVKALSLTRLISWRELPELKHFAGTVTYTTKFMISSEQLAADLEWTLDLGQVFELARVSLNGKDIGTAWHPPYHLPLTDALKLGENSLQIKVPNQLKNALAGEDYARPSGLLGPVRLIPGRLCEISAATTLQKQAARLDEAHELREKVSP